MNAIENQLKELNKKLIESEEKFRAIAEQSNLGICIQQDDRIKYINQRLADLVGYTIEELKSWQPREYAKVIHPDDREYAIEQGRKKQLGSNNVDTNYQFRLIKSTGEIIWVDNYSNAIIYKDSLANLATIIDITEKKKAEIELKESEEKFRLISEKADDLISILDKKMKFEYVNEPVHYRLMGYSREDLIGKTGLELIHPEDRAKVLQEFNKAFKTGEAIAEARIRNKDGQYIWTETKGKSFIDKNNEPKALLITRIITERKNDEKKLKESEEKFKALFKGGPVPTYAWQKVRNDFKLIDYNNAAEEFTYRNVRNYLGLKASEMYKDRPDILKDLHSCFDTKFNITREMKYYINILKEEKDLIVKYSFIPPDLVLVHTEDITRRKIAEENLKESEEKYRLIIENAHEGIWAIDKDANITFVNPRMAEILGYTTDEMLGKHLFDFMDENLIEIAKQYLERRKRGIKEQHDFEFLRKNGTKITTSLNTSPIIDKNGNYVGAVAFITDITVRRKAEYELKESEEKYRHLFENSPFIIVILDLEANIIDLNSAVNNFLTSRTKNDLIGKNIREIFSIREEEKPIIPIILDQIKRTVNGETTEPFEFPLIRSDESIQWIRFQSSLINLEDQNLIQFIGQDITKRKKDRDELRLHSQIMKNMAEGVCLIRADNETFVYINPRFKKLFGYEPDELIGKHVSIINAPTAISPMETAKKITDIVERTGEWHGEVKNIKKDGTTLFCHANISTFKHPEYGKVYVNVIIDMTESKKSEQKLEESEKKYRYIFENSRNAILLINPDGIIIDCNPSTERITGYKKTELINRNFKDLSVIRKKYLNLSVKLFRKLFDGEIVHRVDVEFIKKGGSLIWVSIHASIVNISEEKFMIVLIYDITERKRAEFLVEEELKKLKELEQIRKNLILRVSHELKTPLIPVCSGTEFLLYKYEKQLEEEVSDILKMIEKGGKRLKMLVNKLLDVSRLEYDMLLLEKQTKDLCEIIKECCNDMMHLIKDRGLTLNLDIPNNFYLDIDAMRVEQVIINLLSNAIKNTPPKGKISIGLREENNWATLAVTDTGVGFTKEEMSKVFTRFGKIERLDKGLEYMDIQGSGLGLYLSKEIVDLHGGKIWAASEGRNKGSTFYFSLPIIKK
ncbi:MAG: PAS domain S-box protein [Candidatus Hodarchaeota archaeon]